MDNIGTNHSLIFSNIQRQNEALHLSLRLCPAEIRQLEQTLELYKLDPADPDINHALTSIQIKTVENRLQQLERSRQIDQKVLSKLQDRFTAFQNDYAQAKAQGEPKVDSSEPYSAA